MKLNHMGLWGQKKIFKLLFYDHIQVTNRNVLTLAIQWLFKNYTSDRSLYSEMSMQKKLSGWSHDFTNFRYLFILAVWACTNKYHIFEKYLHLHIFRKNKFDKVYIGLILLVWGVLPGNPRESKKKYACWTLIVCPI